MIFQDGIIRYTKGLQNKQLKDYSTHKWWIKSSNTSRSGLPAKNRAIANSRIAPALQQAAWPSSNSSSLVFKETTLNLSIDRSLQIIETEDELPLVANSPQRWSNLFSEETAVLIKLTVLLSSWFFMQRLRQMPDKMLQYVVFDSPQTRVQLRQAV